MRIVIAKVEMTALVPTGRFEMRDRNWFPTYAAGPEAKGCMWLLDGSDVDVEKAKAAMPGYTVYTFPESETDPIGKAKAMAMDAFISASANTPIKPKAGGK